MGGGQQEATNENAKMGVWVGGRGVGGDEIILLFKFDSRKCKRMVGGWVRAEK